MCIFKLSCQDNVFLPFKFIMQIYAFKVHILSIDIAIK